MQFSQLTPTEQAIVRCIAQGIKNELIASRMHITRMSLERQLSTIYEKVKVLSRVELLLSLYSGQLGFGETITAAVPELRSDTNCAA
jgi:DNA-binding CsgD family transcriptional regulator